MNCTLLQWFVDKDRERITVQSVFVKVQGHFCSDHSLSQIQAILITT